MEGLAERAREETNTRGEDGTVPRSPEPTVGYDEEPPEVKARGLAGWRKGQELL